MYRWEYFQARERNWRFIGLKGFDEGGAGSSFLPRLRWRHNAI